MVSAVEDSRWPLVKRNEGATSVETDVDVREGLERRPSIADVHQIDPRKNDVVKELRELLRRAEKGEILTLITVYMTSDDYTGYYRCGCPIEFDNIARVVGALDIHKAILLREILSSIDREPIKVDDEES